MTPALIILVIPGLPSYNGVEVYYLKGVIGLPIVISFRDKWYYIFSFGNGLIDDIIVIGWTDSDFRISRGHQVQHHSYMYLPTKGTLKKKYQQRTYMMIFMQFLDGFSKNQSFKIVMSGRASSQVHFWLTFFSKLYVTVILQWIAFIFSRDEEED